jgi:hypothetical protein
MTAGFPRPRKLVKKVTATNAFNRKAKIDDKWDYKEYPIPYSSRLDHVGKISVTRVAQCRRQRLCIICGDKVTEEMPWAYVYQEALVTDAGPFHEKCMNLTKTMCPFVATQPERYRFIQLDWASLDNRILPKDWKSNLTNTG